MRAGEYVGLPEYGTLGVFCGRERGTVEVACTSHMSMEYRFYFTKSPASRTSNVSLCVRRMEEKKRQKKGERRRVWRDKGKSWRPGWAKQSLNFFC